MEVLADEGREGGVSESKWATKNIETMVYIDGQSSDEKRGLCLGSTLTVGIILFGFGSGTWKI